LQRISNTQYLSDSIHPQNPSFSGVIDSGINLSIVSGNRHKSQHEISITWAQAKAVSTSEETSARIP
jgi:hypothetical protein